MAGTVVAAVYATAPWRVLTAPGEMDGPRRGAARGDDRSVLSPGLERQTRQLCGPFHSWPRPWFARAGWPRDSPIVKDPSKSTPIPYWLEEFGVLLLAQGRVDDAIGAPATVGGHRARQPRSRKQPGRRLGPAGQV